MLVLGQEDKEETNRGPYCLVRGCVSRLAFMGACFDTWRLSNERDLLACILAFATRLNH